LFKHVIKLINCLHYDHGRVHVCDDHAPHLYHACDHDDDLHELSFLHVHPYDYDYDYSFSHAYVHARVRACGHACGHAYDRVHDRVHARVYDGVCDHGHGHAYDTYPSWMAPQAYFYELPSNHLDGHDPHDHYHSNQ